MGSPKKKLKKTLTGKERYVSLTCLQDVVLRIEDDYRKGGMKDEDQKFSYFGRCLCSSFLLGLSLGWYYRQDGWNG